MNISPRSLLKVAAIAAAGAALASCSGHGSSMMVMMTPAPTPAPDPVAAFGTNFATDFHAAALSTPASIAPGDVVAVSFTTTPMALPSTTN